MSDPFRTPPKQVSADWLRAFHAAMGAFLPKFNWKIGLYAEEAAKAADAAQAEIDKRGGA